MKICRFNDTRLGLVDSGRVYDVTSVLENLAPLRWPLPFGDPLIAQLDQLRPALEQAKLTAAGVPAGEVRFQSVISSASKILAAPANYRKHVEQDTKDPEVDAGVHSAMLKGVERPVDTYGLFLKASSSLVGPADGITIDWPGERRRVDHEVELAVVIGKVARHVPREQAFDYVAGYGLGLDITIRGAEERSFRKSADSFAVFGPWLSTPDELSDPNDTAFWLSVNGEIRQSSSTSAITVPIAELIELASNVYTLYPGDIIMTGTPEGVGPIRDGDIIRAGCDGIGEMELLVREA